MQIKNKILSNLDKYKYIYILIIILLGLFYFLNNTNNIERFDNYPGIGSITYKSGDNPSNLNISNYIFYGKNISKDFKNQ